MTLSVSIKDGSTFIVDDEDAWVLDYRWTVREDTNTIIAMKPHPPGGNVLRRLVAGVEKGGYVTHVNGDRRDFRRSNLTTLHPNAAERPFEMDEEIRVVQNDQGGWVSTALIDGKRQYVGTYGDSDLAWQEARQALALEAMKK